MQLRDNETDKVINDQEKVRQLTQHEGWDIVRKQLTDLILNLQNVNSITGTTATAKEKSMEVNKKVSETLYQWLLEVEGTAEAYDINKDLKGKSRPYLHKIQ